MTPLKPIENTVGVRGVPSKRYPINKICAHPECTERAESVHHIFGRPRGADSDSWFVQLAVDDRVDPENPDHEHYFHATPIPHAVKLCGSGTTGHHGDVDSGMGGHKGWIKYEEGVFVWYERTPEPGAEALSRVAAPGATVAEEWKRVGPLNPQPGSVEGKPKRGKPKGERQPQKVFSVKLPFNEDNLPEEVPRKFKRLIELLEDPVKPRSQGYTLATIFDLALIQAEDSGH